MFQERGGTTAGKKDCCKMFRLLTGDKQLPVLIWAVNRKWKKTEMVERHHKCTPSDTKPKKLD